MNAIWNSISIPGSGDKLKYFMKLKNVERETWQIVQLYIRLKDCKGRRESNIYAVRNWTEEEI